MTLVDPEMPKPPRLPFGVPAFELVTTAGGGGTTLLGKEESVALRAPDCTFGGGGTTSLAPKILPIKLLISDPLAGWTLGGGATTLFDGSGGVPLASWRISCATSAEGGGAITDGAGRFSFGLRRVVLSGAETGGGTTALVICSGALAISRFTLPGAGGMMFAASAGAEREASCDTFGAGATTEVCRDGEFCRRSREMRGAGAMIADPNAGATSDLSFATLGAGGTIVALRFGAVRNGSRGAVGAGAITVSR
jgi:hypothetical protein